jgi:hypothetical protein
VLARPSRRLGRRARLALRAGALAVCAMAVAVGLILAAEQRDRERAETAAAEAAERARLIRIQAPHRGAAPELRPPPGASPRRRLAARERLMRRVERSIAADARLRARAGELDGPISDAECGPFLRAPDAIPDHRVLSKALGRYDCVAVKGDIRRDGEAIGRLGHPFVAAVDFDRFAYVWCRNTPPPGEGGKAKAFVRLARECLAARGRPLGTGYVDVPGS